MDLAEARRRRGLVLEALETLLPLGAELARHAALDEIPAHGRGVGLELGELGDIFLGQGVGDGGHDLGHLHQRALEPAQCGRQLCRIAPAIDLHAEIALPRHACGKAPHRHADAGIAPDAAPQIVLFAHEVFLLMPARRSGLRSS